MSDTVKSDPKAATPAKPATPVKEATLVSAATQIIDSSILRYRLALGGVIFLGALIAIGLGVLIYGLMEGWGSAPSAPASTEPGHPVHMTLAPGFAILSTDTQPGRLILHLRSSSKDEIDIIDTNDGHIVSVISAEAPK